MFRLFESWIKEKRIIKQAKGWGGRAVSIFETKALSLSLKVTTYIAKLRLVGLQIQ